MSRLPRLGAVLRWRLLRWLRRLEIRQIATRLAEETRRLAGLEAARASGRAVDAEELALTRRQIEFLRQEAAWMAGELETARRRVLGAVDRAAASK